MRNYVVTTHLGYHSKIHYFIRKWDDGTYSWEYDHNLDTISKDGFFSKLDTLMSLEHRERLLSIGDSVLV